MRGVTVEESELAAILTRCEAVLAGGGRPDLRALGFWRAVAAVKRHPAWIPRYAARIGAIDQEAFDRSVRWRLPVGPALVGLALGTVAGVVLVLASTRGGPTRKGLLLLVSEVLLVVSTHDLAHVVAGQAVGIRFSEAFLDGKLRIEPGLKIDYASYLRASPLSRAWLHASGAIVSKLVPFALATVAFRERAARWVDLALLASGIGALVIDALFSTRYSDWKRFTRELRIARELAQRAPR